MVVAYQQAIEVIERDFVLAQIGGKPPEIHFQLDGGVIPFLVPQFLNAGIGVYDEAEVL